MGHHTILRSLNLRHVHDRFFWHNNVFHCRVSVKKRVATLADFQNEKLPVLSEVLCCGLASNPLHRRKVLVSSESSRRRLAPSRLRAPHFQERVLKESSNKSSVVFKRNVHSVFFDHRSSIGKPDDVTNVANASA